MMERILQSPAKYIQEAGLISSMDKYVQRLGSAPFFIGTASGIARIEEKLGISRGSSEMAFRFGILSGECSKGNISKLLEAAEKAGCDVIVGIGGGKVIDTAKAVSYYSGKPLIIAPTAASNDAPCSALSVLYDDNGVFDEYLFMRSNPDMVLVDTELIAKAPVRLTVAGMGDALATYYEARAVRRAGKNNQLHAKPTMAGYVIARACHEVLMADGIRAKEDIEAGRITDAVENVIEANIYMSGVGFESGGLAAAHGIQKGMTLIPELHEALHGEIVACCLVCQLIMEGAPREELAEVTSFCRKVGLPVRLSDFGLTGYNDELIEAVARKACAPGATTFNMPFDLGWRDVRDAILMADSEAFLAETTGR